CPSINSAREHNTTSTILRRPSACWRRRVCRTGLKHSSTPPGATAPTYSMPCSWCSATSKDVGIEAELKLKEFGAYFATTLQGKFEGLAMAGLLPGWEPDSVLSGPYTPDSLRNSSHVNDPTLTAMLKEQRRTQDLAARKQRIFAIQRYAAEQ